MSRMLTGLGFAFLIVFFSCSPQRRLAKEGIAKPTDPHGTIALCDSVQPFSSLYISKIATTLHIDEDEFDARISLYYIPDSIIYISAVNAGFEIIRAGIMPDSIVYINRLDKLVYIIEETDMGYGPPASFHQFQLLFNRSKVCESDKYFDKESNTIILNTSIQDISRYIYYRPENLTPQKFEFFHKKTGEYVVGERASESAYVIHANYVVDDLTIHTTGGDVDFNREIQIDLSVNKRKYDILHF